MALIGLSAFGLAACGTVNDQLGLSKSRPDEFAVMRKAPLVLPPNYNLRPPRPGATGPQEETAQEAGARAVFGSNRMAPPPDASQGEVVLLNRAGATEADSRIRQIVDEETASIVAKSDSLTNKILFWQGSETDAPLDSATEAARLRTAAPQAVAPNDMTAAPPPAAEPPAMATSARPVFTNSGTARDPLAQSGSRGDPLATPAETTAEQAASPPPAEPPAQPEMSSTSAGSDDFLRGGMLDGSSGSGDLF